MVRPIAGLMEVRNSLLSIERQAVIAADAALDVRRRHAGRSAQSYPPSETGELKRSIVKRSLIRRRKAVIVGAWYGPFVEYGRRGMAPRPFLRPAIDAVGQRVMDRVSAKITSISSPCDGVDRFRRRNELSEEGKPWRISPSPRPTCGLDRPRHDCDIRCGSHPGSGCLPGQWPTATKPNSLTPMSPLPPKWPASSLPKRLLPTRRR